MKKILFASTICLLALNSIAQDDSQTKIKKTFSIEGAACVTTPDLKAYYYNMGGAQIKFDFNHKVIIALTFLPALGISSVTKTKIITDSYGNISTKTTKEWNALPVLGIGPQLFIKRFILSFPFCYNSNKKVWVATAGIGYKIQYSKSK